MQARVYLGLSLLISLFGIGFEVSGLPFAWHVVRYNWRPTVDFNVRSISITLILFLASRATIFVLRHYPVERNSRPGVWAMRFAKMSLIGLLLVAGVPLIYAFLPKHPGIE